MDEILPEARIFTKRVGYRTEEGDSRCESFMAEHIRHSVITSHHSHLENSILSKLFPSSNAPTTLFYMCLLEAFRAPRLNLVLLSISSTARYMLESFIASLTSIFYFNADSPSSDDNQVARFYAVGVGSTCSRRATYLNELDRYFMHISYAHRKLISQDPQNNLSVLKKLLPKEEALNLSGIPISSLSVVVFLSVIKLFPRTLSSLSLAGCGLCDKKLKILLEVTSITLNNLKELNLSHNGAITDLSFTGIISSMFCYLNGQNSSPPPFAALERLSLAGNEFLFSSINMTILFFLPAIKCIDLSGTAIYSRWWISPDLLAISTLLGVRQMREQPKIANGVNIYVLLSFWIDMMKIFNVKLAEDIYFNLIETLSKDEEDRFPQCPQILTHNCLMLEFDKSALNNSHVIPVFLKILRKGQNKRLKFDMAKGSTGNEGWISSNPLNSSNLDSNLFNLYK